jgi:hypothetical protein
MISEEKQIALQAALEIHRHLGPIDVHGAPGPTTAAEGVVHTAKTIEAYLCDGEAPHPGDGLDWPEKRKRVVKVAKALIDKLEEIESALLDKLEEIDSH